MVWRTCMSLLRLRIKRRMRGRRNYEKEEDIERKRKFLSWGELYVLCDKRMDVWRTYDDRTKKITMLNGMNAKQLVCGEWEDRKIFFPFRCMLMNHPQRHLSAFYEETGINIIFSSFHYTTNWIVAVIDQSYQSLGLHNNITLSTIQVKMMMMMMRWWRQISKIEVIHYKPNNNSEVF